MPAHASAIRRPLVQARGRASRKAAATKAVSAAVKGCTSRISAASTARRTRSDGRPSSRKRSMNAQHGGMSASARVDG